MIDIKLYTYGDFHRNTVSTYEYWLEYNGKITYGYGVDTSAKSSVQLSLMGVLAGLTRIHKPSRVTIYSVSNLGHKNATRSRNSDLLLRIFELSREKSIILEWVDGASLRGCFKWNTDNRIARLGEMDIYGKEALAYKEESDMYTQEKVDDMRAKDAFELGRY